MIKTSYIFESKRLGFRNWLASDFSELHKMNTDPDVMEFFPTLYTQKQTVDFIKRMQEMFVRKSFCYFAVEILETAEFIGFIGMAEQNYQAEFTPCVDIGWRLSTKYWQKGYATEGAKRCLEFAFEELSLTSIYSIATENNANSLKVMEKIGMEKVMNFEHSLLSDYPTLKTCVLYRKQLLSKF